MDFRQTHLNHREVWRQLQRRLVLLGSLIETERAVQSPAKIWVSVGVVWSRGYILFQMFNRGIAVLLIHGRQALCHSTT